MRRSIICVLAAVVIVGCGKTHPVNVVIDPEMEQGSITKIAVFPFASALHPSADPDRVAPRTFDQLFREQL
ncbi:MAG: hypothetical protein P8181_06235, partial [bacterium]